MDDYGARIRKAYRDWLDANDPAQLSWAQITKRIAEMLGEKETGVAVLKWKDGKQEPTLLEFRALARVLGADPRSLAFGENAADDQVVFDIMLAEIAASKTKRAPAHRKRPAKDRGTAQNRRKGA